MNYYLSGLANGSNGAATPSDSSGSCNSNSRCRSTSPCVIHQMPETWLRRRRRSICIPRRLGEMAAFGCIWLQGVVAEAVAVAVSVAVAVALSTGLCGRKTFSQSLHRLSSVWPPLMGCDVSTPEQLATCCRRTTASPHRVAN